jgi:hypothetical protein
MLPHRDFYQEQRGAQTGGQGGQPAGTGPWRNQGDMAQTSQHRLWQSGPGAPQAREIVLKRWRLHFGPCLCDGAM